MGKPKVKKGKSGSRNDSTTVKKRRKMQGGDPGFLSKRIKKNVNKNDTVR